MKIKRLALFQQKKLRKIQTNEQMMKKQKELKIQKNTGKPRKIQKKI